MAPVLDKEKAQTLVEDLDLEMVCMILDNFLNECRQRLKDLPEAIQNKDTETAVREAHSMKSSAANFGAMAMSELGLTMEKAFREGRFDDGVKEAQNLEDITAQTISALEAWKAEQTAD